MSRLKSLYCGYKSAAGWLDGRSASRKFEVDEVGSRIGGFNSIQCHLIECGTRCCNRTRQVDTSLTPSIPSIHATARIRQGKCGPHQPANLGGARQETASGRMRKPRGLISRGICARQRTTESRDNSAGHCTAQAFCRADTVCSRLRASLWGGRHLQYFLSCARGCMILHLFSHSSDAPETPSSRHHSLSCFQRPPKRANLRKIRQESKLFGLSVYLRRLHHASSLAGLRTQEMVFDLA